MADYIFVLDNHLDSHQSKVVAEIARLATEGGQSVWLAGGAMREMLRGAQIRDLDFIVEHDAIKIGKALAHSMKGEVMSEDSLKRWVELQMPGEVRASVSNARTEKYSKPGGKPQIGSATIHEDLSRRDFTINAIALSLNRGSRGLLVDPTNGQADLANKELRTTNSYAFFDDPSRLFRLFRFQHTLGMEPVSRTLSQLENAVLEHFEEAASPAALTPELRAMALHPAAAAALAGLDQSGLLKQVSKAWTGDKINAAGLARFEKAVQAVLPAPKDGWLAFLTVILEKLTPREHADALKALALPAGELAGFRKLEANWKKLEKDIRSPNIHKPSQVWEVLESADENEILMVLYESDQRVVQDRIRAFYAKYLPLAQEITEEQVTASLGAKSGVKPGTPKFAKAMREAIIKHLNARPKKPPEPEPAPLPPPPPPPPLSRGRRV
jgi:tRNA nucleotidyltransferase/poly(A) polymerase